MDVTSQPRATAYLQILEPRKPLPPQTTSFFAADLDILVVVVDVCVVVSESVRRERCSGVQV